MAAPASSMEWKVVRWQQNLLDLTLRNRLLNFKPRWAVQIVGPDAVRTFDRLVNDERMLVIKEAERESAVPQDVKLGEKEVLAAFDPKGTANTLKRMRLKARGAVREQGVNILYAAFGMVRWYDEDDGPELLAPLVMVPVELLRDGPLSPYTVRVIDEEIVVNPTLALKLASDFGLTLPEWPEENADLHAYLGEVARALAPMKRWGVGGEVFLGLFSFSKLSMYKEMETCRDRIAAHPVLNALAGDPSLLPPLPSYPTPEQLDATADPDGSFQMLDADSSQQEAIEMAKGGVSFVLQGPPGTGKSQTIANIIAETLGSGKKVLFVSEKMAALDVVKKRLDDRGLGDHILELHSHKADKSAVVEELRRCLEPRPAAEPRPEDVDRLVRTRTALNEYARALHEVREPLGRSAFYAHGRLASMAGVPELPVPVPRAAAMRMADLDDDLRAVRRVDILHEAIGRMDGHPWSDLRVEGWASGDEALVGSSLLELKNCVGRARQRSAALSDLAGVARPSNLNEAKRLADLLEQSASTPCPPEAWLAPGRPEELLRRMEEMRSFYAAQDGYRSWLAQNYHDGALALDAGAMLHRFETTYRTIFRSLYGTYKQDVGTLQRLSRDGRRPGYKKALADLWRIHLGAEGERGRAAREDGASRDIGPRFRGQATDWKELSSILLWTSAILRDFGALTPQVRAIVCGPGGEHLREPIRDVRDAVRQLQDAFGAAKVRFRPEEALSNLSTASFDRLEAFADRHLAELPLMKEWVELNGLEKACAERGLGELFQLARRKALPAGDLMGGYEKRFFRIWFDALYARDARLRDFRSEGHEEMVRQFRQLDREQMSVAQRRLRARLEAIKGLSLNVPEAKGSELYMLKHELNKKKRFKQIRQLFRDCPHIIMELKPCLLMSPLSVSQYLDPDLVRFDLVIFDEASQVRPEDAVGSILRGSQVIVVGDSRQLPPTAFFRAEAEEEEDELEDLESILDECASIGIGQHMLLWHYRSRHESLIAFSNRHIYGGRLQTFPSSAKDSEERGVSFVHVPDGVYDRGGSRTNPVEARRVAELVFEHFARFPQRTLGVIAFSEAQQMAIIDQVERMRTERPQFEDLFQEGGSEEFFVKNLENVQGDERDAIIFSVGYGKDARGRMFQNFGPLNKAGGERRLNVSVTRARMKVTLVASIRAEDVDGSSSRGAALLREYMAYAAGGRDAGTTAKLDADLQLEEMVFKALTAEGLTVRRQVGCSGYRVDLAIEDPEAPGSFLLGIECDGASYRSGRTARDRDRLRHEVLTGLGWRMHRVWSRDWVSDPRREVEKVKAALERARGM